VAFYWEVERVYGCSNDGSVWKSKLRIVYVTNVEASVANDVSKIAECAHAMKLKHGRAEHCRK
jgi:hypothetical protein